MSALLYKLINPSVKWLLRTPFHGLLSSNTLLLEFTGRKSGQALSTPISYHIAEGRAHCFTAKSYRWWRNLTEGREVHVTIKGKRMPTTPVVETEDREKMVAAQSAFLKAVPRDAKYAGVKLDQRGEPDEIDMRNNISEMVYLSFPLPKIMP